MHNFDPLLAELFANKAAADMLERSILKETEQPETEDFFQMVQVVKEIEVHGLPEGYELDELAASSCIWIQSIEKQPWGVYTIRYPSSLDNDRIRGLLEEFILPF